MSETVWKLAGIVGVHPDAFTLRQLDWMSDAALTRDWELNSWVRAQIINVNLARNVKPIEPKKINPYLAAKNKQNNRGPDEMESRLGFAMMRKTFTETKP